MTAAELVTNIYRALMIHLTPVCIYLLQLTSGCSKKFFSRQMRVPSMQLRSLGWLL